MRFAGVSLPWIEEHGLRREFTDDTRHREGDMTMAVSDQLSKLAVRAKELEDRASAAKAKSKSDLEADVQAARASAQAQGEELRKSADASKGKISAWWDSVQRSWNDHLAAVRNNLGNAQVAMDLRSAERAADQADDDASFAIDYAYAAIEEAEYAVLDAELAHANVDALSKESASTSS